jgi:hypothetical protein
MPIRPFVAFSAVAITAAIYMQKQQKCCKMAAASSENTVGKKVCCDKW